MAERSNYVTRISSETENATLSSSRSNQSTLPVLSKYVTLISSDGFEYIVKREAAYVAGTIRRMLDPKSNFSEAVTGRCVFDTISGVILEKVCEYLYYNEKHKLAKDVPDMDIPPELCLDLLMAADFLSV